MRYVYFTKLLQKLDLKELIAFAREVGLAGFDLAVRPGYPVTPENAARQLPLAVKQFAEADLVVGLVTAPTGMTDPESKLARGLFEACGQAGVPAIKIGYFPYRPPIDKGLDNARRALTGFARLSQRTGVKACYHTHSGNYLGNNGAGLRLLLQDTDPHHVGAFFDTGHTAVNGGPVRMEVDLIRPWLHLVAIKDMARHDKGGAEVVPVGKGFVRFNEVGQALADCKFTGTVSLHGEYPTKDLEERKRLAREELTALKKWLD